MINAIFMILCLSGAIVSGLIGYDSGFWGLLILGAIHREAIK